MLHASRHVLATVLLAAISFTAAPSIFAAEPGFSDEKGKRLTVHNAKGTPVLAIEYAHELDKDGKVTFDTAKVFYHVFAPDGKQTLTKGPGGKLPHHRGIFIGWNKIKHNGKNHDIWHMRNTTQKHVSFTKQEATKTGTTIASRIDWYGTQGKRVLKETRTVTVHHDTGNAYAIIDFKSELTASDGDIELGGDPEHAGIQFRASQQVAQNNSATYTFPVDDAKKKKYTNLPWAAQTVEIDKQEWTIQQMSHPSNPGDNARWSAYRNYGRFGEFSTYKIAAGEKLTLHYRFRITKGQAPERAALNEAYAKYAKLVLKAVPKAAMRPLRRQ